jgi:hypothetical protein
MRDDGWNMLIVATLWWLYEHRRAVLFGIALMIITLLLSSCVVGVLPTTTPAPTGTPWQTTTPAPTPTYTLTTVNITATPEPTPTPETMCIPGSYVMVSEDTPLYDQSDMQRVANVSYTSAEGTFHFEQAMLQAGESALLLFDRTDTAWRVIAAEGSPRLGWLALDKLAANCR